MSNKEELCYRVASVYNLLSDCASFDLTLEQAQKAIDNMVEKVKGWRELFAKYNAQTRSIEHLSGAILPECFFRNEPGGARRED